MKLTPVFALILAAAPAIAGTPGAYVNQFESSDYELKAELSKINDPVAGKAWQVVTGAGAFDADLDAVISDVNPVGGTGRHLRVTDRKGGPDQNLSARLNLSKAVQTSGLFAVGFAVSMQELNSSKGVASISFGQDDAYGNDEHWLCVLLSSEVKNTLIFKYRDAQNAVKSFRAKSADGKTNLVFSDGAYARIECVIDGSTRTYRSLKVDGVEQLGLGSIPKSMNVPAAKEKPLASTFRVLSGSGTTGIIDIDDLTIRPVSQQEP